jgi:hypothetical protein
MYIVAREAKFNGAPSRAVRTPGSAEGTSAEKKRQRDRGSRPVLRSYALLLVLASERVALRVEQRVHNFPVACVERLVIGDVRSCRLAASGGQCGAVDLKVLSPADQQKRVLRRDGPGAVRRERPRGQHPVRSPARRGLLAWRHACRRVNRSHLRATPRAWPPCGMRAPFPSCRCRRKWSDAGTESRCRARRRLA